MVFPIHGSNVRCSCQFYNDEINSHYQAACAVDTDFRHVLYETFELSSSTWLEPNEIARCNCGPAVAPCIIGTTTIRSLATTLNQSALDFCAQSQALSVVRACHDTEKPTVIACEGRPAVTTSYSIMGAESRGNVRMCGTQTVYATCVSYGACPIDCQVGPFNSSSPCSVTCGTGSITLYRSVTRPADYGGAPCPPLTAQTPCTLPPCPVDCQVGPWQEVVPCNKLCGTNVTTYRRREVILYPLGTGLTCPMLTDIVRCPDAPPCSDISKYTVPIIAIVFILILLGLVVAIILDLASQKLVSWPARRWRQRQLQIAKQAQLPEFWAYPPVKELKAYRPPSSSPLLLLQTPPLPPHSALSPSPSLRPSGQLLAAGFLLELMHRFCGGRDEWSPSSPTPSAPPPSSLSSHQEQSLPEPTPLPSSTDGDLTTPLLQNTSSSDTLS